jgi:3-oxoacyl-[acyl-carrier-protein] synthase II
MPKGREQKRRVVITGIGLIAPNGKSVPEFWRRIIEGDTAIGPVTRVDADATPCRAAAEVHGFDPEDYMDRRRAKRLERSLQFSVSAARLAVADAAIDIASSNAERMGVVEATSMSNSDACVRHLDAYRARGYKGISLSSTVNAYVGGGSGQIAEELGIKGSSLTVCSSSASGNDAIGYALSLIRNDEVDLMVAGGAEAPFIGPLWGGFCQSRAMSRSREDPARAMRPFDRDRDGFVLGEGGAFLILEELTCALCRGARIYAEVLAHGRACEAYNAIAPEPYGMGVCGALKAAFSRGWIDPDEVDYINPHGTATEVGDLAETRAISQFFGERASRIAVSSTKPVTGHPMAAAGAFEAAVCAVAIKEQVIPMTLNHEHPGEECTLDYVAKRSRPYPIRLAASLNSGFGGKNSCLIFGRFTGGGRP